MIKNNIGLISKITYIKGLAGSGTSEKVYGGFA